MLKLLFLVCQVFGGLLAVTWALSSGMIGMAVVLLLGFAFAIWLTLMI